MRRRAPGCAKGTDDRRAGHGRAAQRRRRDDGAAGRGRCGARATGAARDGGGARGAQQALGGDAGAGIIVIRRVARRRAAAPETAALLIVWPPYADPMASSALRAFRGAVVWYVGEGRGGACADVAFFDELEESWEQDELHALIRFPGMYDWASRWRRRQR